jgi:geranylgeranyl pyrophosphate synthase
MILGQQYDLDAERNEYNDIKKIHELKTGKLIQAAVIMPHEGEEEQTNHLAILGEIGIDLGLAFQIMDDVLEASSDSKTLGKNNQSDMLNKKLTYVSAYGKKESIDQAYALSNRCVNKLENAFENNEAANLIAMAEFMVKRKN